MLKKLILTLCLFFLGCSLWAQDYLITDFGARPGRAYLNTEAINQAIEVCSMKGGGRVIIPTGVFRSGTIFMQDNVELHFNMGATLLASPNLKDFPIQPPATYRSQKDPGGWLAFIYANGVSNIAITGFGTIDGNGEKFEGYGPGHYDGRPCNILFISCNDVRVEGVRMMSSAMWNQHYLNCEDVIVDRIKVYNHSNRNNDGIDIDGCRGFILSNSIIDTDDDAITLKSTGKAATENVVITNCIVSSFCNAIKMGTESTGGFRNISISNCVIKPSRNKSKPIYGFPRGITGISLEIVDGGVMEGITISNITIEGTACPLYVRLANRARKHVVNASQPPMGKMRNISINNLVAYNTGNYSSSITSIPGSYIENVSLKNVQFHNVGGVKSEGYLKKIADVNEDEKGYPQPSVWKNLPSSGLFIRHVKNIQIDGLMLGSKKSDPRIPIVAEDVKGIQIQEIAKIGNCEAGVFFYGKNIKNFEIEKPLGWKGEVVKIGK